MISGGGEIQDITVEILKDIRTDIRKLVDGQDRLVQGQTRIEERLDHMLVFIGERY